MRAALEVLAFGALLAATLLAAHMLEGTTLNHWLGALGAGPMPT